MCSCVSSSCSPECRPQLPPSGIVKEPFCSSLAGTLHCDPVCACVFMRTPETKFQETILCFLNTYWVQKKHVSASCLQQATLRGEQVLHGERSGLLTYCQVAGLLSGGGLPWAPCSSADPLHVCLPGPTVPPCGTSVGG